MQITKVEKQEKRERYNVFADGKFLTALDAGVLAESGLREGEIVTKSELEVLLTRDRFAKALTKAYSLLSRRAHGSVELRRKLLERGYAAELADEVITHLTELGYLNDTEFARQWVASRGTSRGPRLLRGELRQRGVSTEAIEAALESLGGEVESARALAEKRLPRYKNEAWESVQRKLTNYLVGRGYSFDVIRQALEPLRPPSSSG